MQLPRAYQIIEVFTTDVADTQVEIPINNRVFMISNTGAETAYFMPEAQGDPTEGTGFPVPAGQVFPMYFSCDGNLSLISTLTGTSVAILYLDV